MLNPGRKAKKKTGAIRVFLRGHRCIRAVALPGEFSQAVGVRTGRPIRRREWLGAMIFTAVQRDCNWKGHLCPRGW
jgi:hypothetical protein